MNWQIHFWILRFSQLSETLLWCRMSHQSSASGTAALTQQWVESDPLVEGYCTWYHKALIWSQRFHLFGSHLGFPNYRRIRLAIKNRFTTLITVISILPAAVCSVSSHKLYLTNVICIWINVQFIITPTGSRVRLRLSHHRLLLPEIHVIHIYTSRSIKSKYLISFRAHYKFS